MRRCPRAKISKRRNQGVDVKEGGRGTRLVEIDTQPISHRSNAPEGMTQFKDLHSPRFSAPAVPDMVSSNPTRSARMSLTITTVLSKESSLFFANLLHASMTFVCTFETAKLVPFSLPESVWK